MIGQPPRKGLVGIGRTAEFGVGSRCRAITRVTGTGDCRFRRFSGWSNFLAPNSGLRGVPVGTLGKGAARQGAESPFLHTSSPPEVKIPQRIRSRRVICPLERALTISARLLRALCASRWRARDAFCER